LEEELMGVAAQSDSQRNRLKVGLILTPVEDRAHGSTPSWNELRDMARVADDVGFSSIWISDHLIHIFPELPPYGIWECWSLVSALAASTTRVHIGTWVMSAGFRNPALLAKMAETADEISGGRIILGLGAGWHEPEYKAFGFPYEPRVARFEEAIAIVHGLLRNGHVDFSGKYYETRNCELRPRGPRPRGLPIMIGTIAGTPLARRLKVTNPSTRMLNLVAQYADIWNCPWINRPEEIPAARETVDAACRAAGRDPSTLARTNGVMVNLEGWESAIGNEAIRAPRADLGPIEGSLEHIAMVLRRFADEGVGEVHVQLDPETPEAIERFARVLEMLTIP
jgi:alkanesulfonate monooxygenase SsuD/methylene tetrahydromethanopterin reductase-like flavin-dependent oxidoreductase (luciferase family)